MTFLDGINHVAYNGHSSRRLLIRLRVDPVGFLHRLNHVADALRILADFVRDLMSLSPHRLRKPVSLRPKRLRHFIPADLKALSNLPLRPHNVHVMVCRHRLLLLQRSPRSRHFFPRRARQPDNQLDDDDHGANHKRHRHQRQFCDVCLLRRIEQAHACVSYLCRGH